MQRHILIYSNDKSDFGITPAAVTNKNNADEMDRPVSLQDNISQQLLHTCSVHHK